MFAQLSRWRSWLWLHEPWSLVVALVVLVSVILVGGRLVALPVDAAFHLHTQLAGSNGRLGAAVSDTSQGDTLLTLGLDCAFACVYGSLLAFVIWIWRLRWHDTLVQRLTTAAALLALVTAGLDIVENVLTAVGLDFRGPTTRYRGDGWALAVTTVAWWKWLGFSVVVLVAVATLVKALLPAPRRPPPPPSAHATAPAPSPALDGDAAAAPELGICCSGGGIRAAAYTLGALRELQQSEGDVLGKARWLAAVSGGGYLAGADQMLELGHPEATLDQLAKFLVGDSSSPSHHRFLENDPGGLARALLYASLCVVANVVAIGVALFVVAWPLGWVFGTWAFRPDYRNLAADSQDWSRLLSVPTRLWLPGVVLVGVALVVLLLSAVLWRGASRVARFSVPVLAAGLGVLTILVVLPWSLAAFQWLLRGRDPGFPGSVVVFGVSLTTILGVLWRVAQKPLGKLAPRLGGVLLAVVAALFAGDVATDAMTGHGLWHQPCLWAVVTVVAVGLGLIVDSQWATLRRLYCKKLRRTFSVELDGDTVAPRAEADLPTVDQLPTGGPGPELLICAAAQRIGLSGNGIPAESFTISASEVRFGTTCVPTREYLSVLPTRMERTVASWQANAGAAFSSAMGRFGYGSTNALLAALNIDLGAWLPNPTFVNDGFLWFPRVRYVYLLKEIVGRYEERDPFVFVADGGQWENLGLVELLRRHCNPIICIDASGDTPDTFATLRQAMDLATTELDGSPHVASWAPLDRLHVEDGSLPVTTVTRFDIVDDDAPCATLIYAKLQVAADLPLPIRTFAKQDRKFPSYSTAKQLLSDEQFAHLVELGGASGSGLAELYAEWLTNG